MINTKMKIVIMLSALVFMVLPILMVALPVSAQIDEQWGLDRATNLNLSDADPRDAAISLVRLLMTFLGIIAVVIILLGGFKWMTAAGNDDKVAEAKKIISAGIIGLVIILSAFLIVNFVIGNVSNSLR